MIRNTARREADDLHVFSRRLVDDRGIG